MKEQIQKTVNEVKVINDITLKNEIVIFGSTYMKNFPFYELVNKCKLENAVYNRSIEDLTLDEAYEVLQTMVLDIKPSKIFLCLGESEYKDDNAFSKYKAIIYKIRKTLPHTIIYTIALPYIDASFFNKKIKDLCDDKKIIYVQLSSNGLSIIENYKVQFKQLAHFFRDKSLTLSDIFAIANL